MAPYYEHVCGELGWPKDVQQLGRMREANAKKMAELDTKVKDAEENLGETEVRDALQAKADYLCSIGDKEGAPAAHAATEGKTAGPGVKVDLVLSQLRLMLLYSDWAAVKQLLGHAKRLCEEGGDWERKNRLKVYQAVLHMYTREFKAAAELLLESMATFTTTELFSYTQLIFYTVVCAAISLDRVALRKRVIDAPEVLSCIEQVRISFCPTLREAALRRLSV